MSKQLEAAANNWAQKRVDAQGTIRVYAKLCLSGGILVGSRFSRTRGAIVEVLQKDQLWSSAKHDASYIVDSDPFDGNNTDSKLAVIALSVTMNLQVPVINHLRQTDVQYKRFVNMIPRCGASHESMKSQEEAVSFAIKVKKTVDELKSEGIEQIYLYLNCPFGAAVIVGHYLTAAGPIQVFEYLHPGYTKACLIG